MDAVFTLDGRFNYYWHFWIELNLYHCTADVIPQAFNVYFQVVGVKMHCERLVTKILGIKGGHRRKSGKEPVEYHWKYYG
jgi:hypothetical protein